MFNTLHMMFMTQYTEVWNGVDPIAERIRSLGFNAPGSYGQYGARRRQPPQPASKLFVLPPALSHLAKSGNADLRYLFELNILVYVDILSTKS